MSKGTKSRNGSSAGSAPQAKAGARATGPAALRVENLSFAYRAEGDEGFSLRVHELELAPGEQALLTAASGRGKSTLLHLIAGLLEAESGRVLVGGQEVHALRGAARDRLRGERIGMIFQTFNLLNGFTAMENVMAAMMFSAIPATEHGKRAAELLDRVGIAQRDRAVERLSVGQQQRVAVARAVACRPMLVLADEPTASLDPSNSDAAMELIQGACRESGAALLCTSHDPSMRARFARCIDLAELSRACGGGA